MSATTAVAPRTRGLLSIRDLDADGITRLLDLTDTFVEVSARPIARVPALRGKTIAWVFYEDSTRTRLSFESAAKRLSADTMNFSVASSSVKKGESVRDTILTIEAMGVDAVVVRHGSSGVPRQIAGWTDAAVINAGDGWHEHPTQALLDCYTIRQSLGGLAGKRIAIVGDIRHSRVARSDVLAFTRLGADVTLVAPPTLLPPSLEGWPVTVSHDLDDVAPKVDVLYLLRMQRERMTEALLPSLREYTARYGLTDRRIDDLAPEAIVMHPGPMNRGVEISAAAADLDRTVVVDQVRNGVAVRMAVLFDLLGIGHAMSELHITGGTLIDQTGSREADIVVRDGLIASAEGRLAGDERTGDEVTVLDASGCVVAPGLVDLHAHLRQPGREEAETVETGARAAARGGFTAVVAMPNTDPAMDSAAVVEEVKALGAGALCDVHPSAAVTVGRAGEQLTPMAELADLGVRIFTDDGDGVQDARLMRRALEYASGLGKDVTLAQHCEVDALADGGHMHEGAVSSRLGVPGVPSEAEELMVARDIALGRLTGARMHFQHLSTAGSVDLVRRAKAAGLAVTAEACPHHFTLTDDLLEGYDPVFKVNPPLRPAEDVAAVRVGLADGTLDAVATDHAPHQPESKELPIDQAPPGMVGLETALALATTELDLPLEKVLALLSWQPATIAGLDREHGGPVVEGRAAHLVVIDPAETWTVDPADSASRSRNNPYAGRELTGRVRHTILRGEPVVVDGRATR